MAHSGAYLLEGDAPTGVIDDVAFAEMHGRPGRDGKSIGNCLAVVGDVTGDGIADVQVCGEFEEADLGNPVFDGPHVGYRDGHAAYATTLRAEDRENAPGSASPCGDVSGDGLADLCMGSGPSVVVPATYSKVYVLLGPIPPGAISMDDADIELRASVSELAGQTMTGGADLTGDGVTDLLVGANERDESRGGAYLVSDLTPGVHDLADWPLWTGEEPFEQAGLGLAVGGDLDGDGLGDAFIGAHIWNNRRGRGFVVTDGAGGPLTDAFLTLEGQQERDWFGADAAIGDFDGDGQDDLAVGIPRDIYFGFDEPGRVALFYGPLTGGVRNASQADRMLRGSDYPDAFGFALDAGDVDGDGRADLAIGAPFDDTVGEAAGAVHLYLGTGLGR